MRKILSVVLCLVFVVALVAPASAQDDMMSDKIVCDSTVITLLLVAENNFGFHSMMDVSQFEKGQFQPLFDTMMANMDEMSGDEMSGDDMADNGDMMEESTMGDEMMGDEMMVTLEPGNIMDEPTECADLRAEVEGFLYDTLSMDLGMAEDGM
jgi:hypothetical protein